MPSSLAMPLHLTNKVMQVVVPVKNSVSFSKKKGILLLFGPLGHLFYPIPSFMKITKKGCDIHLLFLETYKKVALTYISLLRQKIKGVDLGWFEVLTVQGIG
jgi:ribosomal protein L6P/L9E